MAVMLSKPSNPSIRFHEPQCSSQESSLGSRHSVGPLCGGYRYPKSKGVFALFAHLNLSISEISATLFGSGGTGDPDRRPQGSCCRAVGASISPLRSISILRVHQEIGTRHRAKIYHRLLVCKAAVVVVICQAERQLNLLESTLVNGSPSIQSICS